ncbi:hypothetical protein F0562_007617 [Nyssa sinensis]|uniref:Uncharacterized protein n=1 Tax=Nyssa sinensis TaxID=561372 RepID=A0A5J5A7B8_9ASTE|nr:hypothetical protein F0562_007617 [Nyssa sinensis]
MPAQFQPCLQALRPCFQRLAAISESIPHETQPHTLLFFTQHIPGPSYAARGASCYNISVIMGVKSHG